MKNNTIHKVKPQTIIGALFGSIINIGLIIFGFMPPYYFLTQVFHKVTNTESFWSIIIFILAILLYCSFTIFIPVFITLNHYKYDKSTILTIDKETDQMIYTKNGHSILFHIADIELSKVVHSRFTSLGNSYIILWLKDGRKIIMTSLLSENPYKYSKKVKIKQEWLFFPLLNSKEDRPM